MAVAALLLFGLVLVGTASSFQSGGAVPFLKKQIIAAVVGLAMAVFCALSKHSIWRNRSLLPLLSGAVIVGTMLVFLWKPVNGSCRWIYLPGFSLQPSEFSRIVLLMALAAWYAGIGQRSREFKRGVLIPLLIIAAFVAPIIKAPDVGATMVMCVGAGAILLAAGVKWRWILPGAFLMAGVVALVLIFSPNRRARVMVFVDRIRGVPISEATAAAAYHSEQSLEAFSRGGMRGRGIGGSIQKYRYLPEANSDFIFAIAAEEFGIAATVPMVLAYMVILLCGIYIAYHAPDRFSKFLSLGLTVMLTFEAAFNIGMTTGCLPTKGIALPFVSAGGSSLMASLAIIGILISIGAASIEGPSSLRMKDAQIEY